MRRLYLSAPMSGEPSFNIPALSDAFTELFQRGYEVVSPAELDDPAFRDLCIQCLNGSMEELKTLCTAAGIKFNTWGDLLARDVKLLSDDGIDAIVVLPGWEKSKGARLETFVGRLLKLPILAYPSLNPIEQYKLEYTHALPAPGILKPMRSFGTLGPPWGEGGTELDATGKPVMKEAPPLDTAESVQADAECTDFKTLLDAELQAYAKDYKRGEREWRQRDARTGGEKGAKQAVLGDAAPETLTELARVYGFGRKKYDRLNYLKGYDWSLSYDACERHLRAFWERKENDGESGLHHLAHAAWHCLTLMAFSIRNLGTDDRP